MNDAINLEKLFLEKKYTQIISIIEKIPHNKRNSGLLNLLGVCKMSLSGSNENLESAIKEFKNSYLKEKNSTNAFHALRNLINASVILFDNKYQNNETLVEKDFFNEIFEFYNQNKNYFENNIPHALAIIKVFKRCLDIDSVIRHLNRIVEKDFSNTDALSSLCFFNNLKYDWDQAKYLKYSRMLNDRLKQYSSKELINLKSKKQKKINLAFISSDIRFKHSVTYFLRSILTEYDKEKFNIYLYLNSKYEDETTSELKRYVYSTKNIVDLNDLSAINLIRKDQIDIVIDLNGFSSNHRLTLFKNRIAPIQISWCGYTNTTGLNEMDYLITDKNLIYKSEQNLYSEKVIYMSDIWNCHSGYNTDRNKIVTPLENNKFVTFGSFNNFLKINDDVVKVWSSILKKVDKSKLILKSSIPCSKEEILKKFKKNGISSEIEFLPFKKSFDEHLKEYKKIDIALDTFPWNGVTTSFEAIWMGVPVITIKGFNFSSRCGESINKNIGLNNLIAINQDDYVNKSVMIANDKKKLEELRKKIFDNALESSLFNKEKFSKFFYNCIENTFKEKYL